MLVAVTTVRGAQICCSNSVDSRPSTNALCHCQIVESPNVSFPNVSFNNAILSVGVFFKHTQNLITQYYSTDIRIFSEYSGTRSLAIYECSEHRSKFIRRFNAISSDYKISIKNTELIEDPSGDEQVDLITTALEEMIEVAKRHTNFRIHDRINIVIRNPVLHYPISTGYQKGNSTRDLVQILMETISRILTSNEDLDLTTSTFNVIIIAMPQGAQPKGSKILDLAEAKQTKNSIVQIKNKDNLCCPRAVIVALTYRVFYH